MALRKRSVLLSGHATSVALEAQFWEVLEAMAAADGLTLIGLIGRIDANRAKHPLASACRIAALEYLRRS
jgi:predicted DNA-binding ribbon-helix-helix protein